MQSIVLALVLNKLLALCMPSNFASFFCCLLTFFTITTFPNYYFWSISRDCQRVLIQPRSDILLDPDLGPNCLPRGPIDDANRQSSMICDDCKPLTKTCCIWVARLVISNSSNGFCINLHQTGSFKHYLNKQKSRFLWDFDQFYSTLITEYLQPLTKFQYIKAM